MAENTEALNILMLSGEFSKLEAAALVSMMSASYGKTVRIFVSMDALPAFHKDPQVAAQVQMSPVATRIKEKSDDYLTLLRQAKEMGDVHIYACSLVMDLYGWKLDDFQEGIFDDALGVAGFLAQSEGQPVMNF
ncbi:Peroxiredoxin family protein [Candidatus Hydrogenisulfobacillus filiaventi]|uniref:Peroxiredoxin family protein n=1 Tax=Candidatus Hydrogenisulfobacillus filiaventi TaxID=2707344 RepID=A0A6F8ZEC9_9FIRM|nr:DsrE/DsrF/DrsH-like family protein [Bacillota bacterium]CAB1128020.1 Peroxiredoxin family protein [Candidatus Hydrogenisulfobacillus filiaventi]